MENFKTVLITSVLVFTSLFSFPQKQGINTSPNLNNHKVNFNIPDFIQTDTSDEEILPIKKHEEVFQEYIFHINTNVRLRMARDIYGGSIERGLYFCNKLIADNNKNSVKLLLKKIYC